MRWPTSKRIPATCRQCTTCGVLASLVDLRHVTKFFAVLQLPARDPVMWLCGVTQRSSLLFYSWEIFRMSTYFPKAGEIARKWYVVDASGQTRAGSPTVARILTGKQSPKYTPFLDAGDHVVVINADKVKTRV